MGTLPLHVYTPDPTMPVPVIFKDVTRMLILSLVWQSPSPSQSNAYKQSNFVLILQILLGHVAALLTLKANSFNTLTMKQREIMINNDVLLFSATNEKTPYKQLLYYLFFCPPQLNITALFSLGIITEDIINDDHCHSIEGRKWVVVCYHYYYY